VAQLPVLYEVPDNIHPEAIHAFVQPKSHYVKHGFLYVRVPPVQVGLFFKETMIIVLLGVVVPFPGITAKYAFPVVWWTTVGLAIMPDIPIALRGILRAFGFNEPRVAVGCMVGYQIEDYLQFPAMRLLKKLVEICHRSKLCIYRSIISNVIAKVGHG